MPRVGWWPTTSTGSRDSGQLVAASTAVTRRAGRKLVHRLELALERLRRLLRAVRGRNEDAAGIGQVRVEPCRHALGLLHAFAGEAPPEVGLARLGFACRQRIRSIGSRS